ncbi:MAG: phenylalanine--tRNA ligase subunit beta [Candidatus Omnitrophica bacterium]|nr:phenylalanine--tRNA ligase subunit beta [Candidatus Omnitrophota bacterium]
MKISTNWLKEFVKFSPPVERIAERLTMCGLEIKDIRPSPAHGDIIFETEVTTNRPDWLSHLGVAREIAAVENLSLKLPDTIAATNRPLPSGWRIHLKELDGCPYYTGVLIEGIQWCDSPDFMKARLEACGLRSINLIVDITNYVLLEIGQPLHAFDADLLQGKEIQIRRAKSNEKMEAIDKSVLTFQSEDLVIADHDRSVACAGIMGSSNSEVSEKTRNIFLESAFFNPRWIRFSSRRLGLASESSYRFERRVDPEGVDMGRDRALELIQRYAKPRFISGVIKSGERPMTVRQRIHLNAAAVGKVLGVDIKASEIFSILNRLGLDVKPLGSNSWSVGISSYRSDLTRPIDLIEEIARIYGYEHIPATLPERAPLCVSENVYRKLERKTRQFFSGLGLYETVTFSLVSEQGLDTGDAPRDYVKIINPQNKDLCWMRPVLFPSLLNVIQKNANFGAKQVAVYEVANIYRQSTAGKHPVEERSVGIGLYGHWQVKSWKDPERDVTFYDLKGLIESYLAILGIESVQFREMNHPALTPVGAEEICIDHEILGFLGEIHPRVRSQWDLKSPVYFAQLSLEKLSKFVRWLKPLNDLPRFPAIERDLSLMVPDAIKAGEIAKAIQTRKPGLIQKVELFDLFRGGRIPKGYKNLSFRIYYQSMEKTLVSEDIQSLHEEIGRALVIKFQGSFQDSR